MLALYAKGRSSGMVVYVVVAEVCCVCIVSLLDPVEAEVWMGLYVLSAFKCPLQTLSIGFSE